MKRKQPSSTHPLHTPPPAAAKKHPPSTLTSSEQREIKQHMANIRSGTIRQERQEKALLKMVRDQKAQHEQDMKDLGKK